MDGSHGIVSYAGIHGPPFLKFFRCWSELFRDLLNLPGPGPSWSGISKIFLVLVRAVPRFLIFSGPCPGPIGFGPWISGLTQLFGHGTRGPQNANFDHFKMKALWNVSDAKIRSKCFGEIFKIDTFSESNKDFLK